jgi:hypothetical protein
VLGRTSAVTASAKAKPLVLIHELAALLYAPGVSGHIATASFNPD